MDAQTKLVALIKNIDIFIVHCFVQFFMKLSISIEPVYCDTACFIRVTYQSGEKKQILCHVASFTDNTEVLEQKPNTKV